MDKYRGCNVVESVKSDSAVGIEKRKTRSALFVRLVIAVAVIGLFAVLKFAPWSALDPVRGVVRTVFCYDAFGRTDFGSMPVITRFAEWVA